MTDISGGGISVDTEDAVLDTVVIQGYEATTIQKLRIDGYGNRHEQNRVVWPITENGWFVSVSSNDEGVDVLSFVAENLFFK